jgi:hypothetical protein
MLKLLLILILSSGLVGCSNETDFNSWVKESEEHREAFIDIHKDIKEINEEFVEIADKTGELIAYTFVDRLIYEVNMLTSRIENEKWRIGKLEERIKKEWYHTDDCEYQNPDWVVNTRICREHKNYLRYGDWRFGEVMTKEDMLDKIQEHEDEIQRSLDRIDEAKVEAVELDKQIKAGYRHEGTNELVDDIKADMKFNEESKDRGVEAFDRHDEGFNRLGGM